MDDIKYDSSSGYAKINGICIWLCRPRTNHHHRWLWEAVKYVPHTHPPEKVDGIGSVSGMADSEEEALELATAAANLVGRHPGEVG